MAPHQLRLSHRVRLPNHHFNRIEYSSCVKALEHRVGWRNYWGSLPALTMLWVNLRHAVKTPILKCRFMGEKDIHDTILTVRATNAVILVNISLFQSDFAGFRAKGGQYSPKSLHLWHELLLLCHEAKKDRGMLYAPGFKTNHLPAESLEYQPFLSTPTQWWRQVSG